MDSVQLLTLYLTLTPIFSGRKAKINLHTTPKLTVVMPISCLLPCADPGIFVRGWGGGSTSIGQKSSDNVVFFCLCFFCLFFAFFLVLSLFFEVKWLISKKNIIFQVSGGGPSLSRGGGGPTFSRGGGVELLIPYRDPYNLWFSGGSGPPVPPPSGSALGCDLFSSPVRKMMWSPLAPVLVFLQLRCMFSVEPRDKIVSWTYCMTVAWLFQHLTSLAIRLCFLQSLIQ